MASELLVVGAIDICPDVGIMAGTIKTNASQKKKKRTEQNNNNARGAIKARWKLFLEFCAPIKDI